VNNIAVYRIFRHVEASLLWTVCADMTGRSCASLDVATGREQHCTTRPDVVISGIDDLNDYNKSSSSSHGSVYSVSPSVSASSLSNNNKWRRWLWTVAACGRTRSPNRLAPGL